jgi:hypothetical protein
LGLHLAARPADLGADRRGRFDPLAGGRAGPRRARLPDVLLDLGARLGLPGMVDEDGMHRRNTGGYADYIVNHERKPGIGPLAGWRGEDGDKTGRAKPNPDQLERYIENGGFSQVHVPEEAHYFKHANRAWSDWAIETRAAGRAGGEHLPALSRTVAQVPARG